MRISRREFSRQTSICIVVSAERAVNFGFERFVKDVRRLLGFELGIVE